MATLFTLSTGVYLTFEALASSVDPSNQYDTWATAYGFPTTGTDYAMDGDDKAFCIPAPSFIGTGNFFTLSSEGGFELPLTASNIASLPTDSSTQISIPNIHRYYTTYGMTTTRFCLTFHPMYDAGSIGVRVRLNEQYLLCSGRISRNKQAVDFALFIDIQGRLFDLYLSTGDGIAIPIYALELGASGYVADSQVLVATMPANGKLRVRGFLYTGIIGGYVYDSTGAGVARVVRAYQRSSGELSGETTSSAGDGSFVLKTSYPGEHYVVALDDDAAPDFNALIFDRVVPQPPY